MKGPNKYLVAAIVCLLIAIGLVGVLVKTSQAQGEPCSGDWNCSWDEYCHKPDWRKGICVRKG